MQAFYKITQKIKDILMDDPNVHTVLFGVDNYRDLYKKVIYPVAHINPVGGSFASSQQNVVTLEISVLDQRDLSKNSKIESKWLSNDNQIDTLNTAHAVLNRLCARLRYTHNEGIEILSVTEAVPVIFRELDLVDGWLITITLAIPNTIDVCILPEDQVASFTFSAVGYENEEEACDDEGLTQILYTKSAQLGFSTVLYTDEAMTIIYNGSSNWYKSGIYTYNINEFGFVIGIYNCEPPLPEIFRHEITIGAATGLDACLPILYPEIVFSLSPVIGMGTILYESEVLSPPYAGGDLWYKDIITDYAWQVNNAGQVVQQFLCPPISCPLGYEYQVDTYLCDCSNIGLSSFANATQLTVGSWYFDSVSGNKFVIQGFSGCSTGFTRTILDSTKQDNCASVICGTGIPYNFSDIARDDSVSACGDPHAMSLFTLDTSLSTTTKLYTNSELTSVFQGHTKWYKSGINAYLISDGGFITQIIACPSATYQYNFTPIGRDTGELTCNDGTFEFILYSTSPFLALDVVLFEDFFLTIPYVGGNMWHKASSTSLSYQIGDDGSIDTVFTCASIPLYQDSFTSIPRDSAEIACSDGVYNKLVFTTTEIFTNGTTLFNNTSLTVPFNGGEKWYHGYAYNTSYQVGFDGAIMAQATCVGICNTNSYQYQIDIYNCDCSVSGGGSISNTEILEVGRWYYDTILAQKVQVVSFIGCGDETDRSILKSSGQINCGDVVCPCIGYSYVFTNFACADCDNIGGGALTNSEELTVGMYYYDDTLGNKIRIDSFEGCSPTFNRSIPALSGVATCAEVTCPTAESFEYFYTSHNCTDCLQNGSGVLYNNTTLTVGNWFHNPNTGHRINIIAAGGVFPGFGDNYIDANGVGTCAEVECPCVRPTGLNQAFVLTGFTTNIASACGEQFIDIEGSTNLSEACERWQDLKNCACDVLANSTNGISIEYSTIAVGEKMYAVHGSPICDLIVRSGIFFFWDTLTPDATSLQSYFCPLDTVTIVTVGADGIITAVDTCTYECVRPVGLEQKVFIASFAGGAGSPCGNTNRVISSAPDFAAACAMFADFKNCACTPYSITALGYNYVEISSLTVGEIAYSNHGDTSCNVCPVGRFFFVDSTDPFDISLYCAETSIIIVTVGAGGVITAVETCNYAECRPAGMHQALRLSSFGTHSSSPCGIQNFNIQNAVNLSAVCNMWTSFKQCVCPAYPISAQSFGEIEYIALTPGNKLFLGWDDPDCNFYAEPGFYFLWDSTNSSNLKDYFCNIAAVTVITVGALGVITAVTTCSAPVFEYAYTEFPCDDCGSELFSNTMFNAYALTVGTWFYEPLGHTKFRIDTSLGSTSGSPDYQFTPAQGTASCGALTCPNYQYNVAYFQCGDCATIEQFTVIINRTPLEVGMFYFDFDINRIVRVDSLIGPTFSAITSIISSGDSFNTCADAALNCP